MIKGRGWCSETIKERYANSFYFYFTKPINSIVAGEPTPVSIQFKDFLYWDHRGEIMRRFYTIPESEVRLRNYITSYMEIYDRYPPNLCTLKPYKILNKRAKRFLKQIKREHEEAHLIRGKRKAFEPLLPQLLKNPVYLCSRDFSTTFQQMGRSKPQFSNQSLDFIEKMEFDSKLHDIYDPEFSSRQSESSIVESETDKLREKLRKSKSKTNLVGGLTAGYLQPAIVKSYGPQEKLSDLFTKYKDQPKIEQPELSNQSREKFQDSIRSAGVALNIKLSSSALDLKKKTKDSKKKRESTNATDRDSDFTKDKFGSLTNRLKTEAEEKNSMNVKMLYQSSPKPYPLMPKKIKNFGKALKNKMADATHLAKTPAFRLDLSQEDICASKRSADIKSKKKLNSDFAFSSVLHRSVGLKKVNTSGGPTNKQRLLEKLNTDRSSKKSASKWLIKDTSRSKTNIDLFKSVKMPDSTLKKHMKKMAQPVKTDSEAKRLKSSKPSQSKDAIKMYQSVASSDIVKPLQPFFNSSKKPSLLMAKFKKQIQSIDKHQSHQKSQKSMSRRKENTKALQSFQGRSLANISSAYSNEKIVPHYLYAKKFSTKELHKGGMHSAITAHNEPQMTRQSSSKSKKFDNLVLRLIENSQLQSQTSSRGNQTDRFAYFGEVDSHKKHFRGLFTTAVKNR